MTHKRYRTLEWQSQYDNPEKQTTYSTQSTGKIHIREIWGGNYNRTIQRNRQHRVLKTKQTLENTGVTIIIGQSRETGSIGYTKYMTNKC